MSENNKAVTKNRMLLTEAEESRKKFLESKAEIANRIISILHEAGFENTEVRPDLESIIKTIRIDVKLS